MTTEALVHRLLALVNQELLDLGVSQEEANEALLVTGCTLVQLYTLKSPHLGLPLLQSILEDLREHGLIRWGSEVARS